MKKDVKLAVVVALIEAILAFIVGYTLYLVQANSIEEKTIEKLSEYFDDIDQNMSYDQVMKSLYESSKEKDELIQSLTKENEELTASLKDLSSIDEVNKEVIDSAQIFADSNEYQKALSVLNSIIDKTPQMEVMISDYQSRYISQTITNVDEYTSNGKYNEAIELIEDALKVIPNNSILLQKKEVVKNSQPQTFMNVLHPYEIKGYSEIVSGQFMEMGGTKYFNGFQLGSSWETSYAIFNLNAQYTQISGIIGHVDGSGDSDKTVSIFADGILIETIDINYQNLPQNFSIDVTGVKQLKFERTDGSTQTGFGELIIK